LEIDLPKAVRSLTRIWCLQIGSNKLTTFPPDDIARLVQLEKFFVGYNDLSCLPPSITKASAIKELWLSGNKFQMFSSCLPELTSLRELYFANAGLVELPRNISQLVNLKILFLTSNLLTALPDEFCKLTEITELDLSHNRLSCLPESFGALFNLVDLDLSGNQLETLPSSLGDLTRLMQLKLNYNKLSAIPQELTILAKGHLEWLSLEGNLIDSLPAGLEVISDFHPQVNEGGVFVAIAIFTLLDLIVERFHANWAEMRGLRNSMEDTLIVCQNFRGRISFAYRKAINEKKKNRKRIRAILCSV